MPPFFGTQIDNSVFRLHYDFTVGFFFLSTGLLRYKGSQILPCFNQFICICQPQRFVWESDSLPWVGRVKSDRGPRCSHTVLLGFWNLYRLESATYTDTYTQRKCPDAQMKRNWQFWKDKYFCFSSWPQKRHRPSQNFWEEVHFFRNLKHYAMQRSFWRIMQDWLWLRRH